MMAKLIRLKLYICDFYENLDHKTMEVVIHRALNGTAGSAMTDIFEIEEKAITWADDNPINQLNATQETWDEQFGSKNTKAVRIEELEAECSRMREALHKIAEMEAGSHEPSFEMRGCMTSESCMNCDEMIDIAREALEGVENVEKDS